MQPRPPRFAKLWFLQPLVLGASACVAAATAAPTAAAPGVVVAPAEGVTAASVAPATRIAAPAPAGDDATSDSDLAPATERALRERLAIDDDPASALELAAFLCDDERHRDALAVLDRAIGRCSHVALRVARAGVQRDLGWRHLAAAELRRLHEEHGSGGLHPGLLFELAELEWLEGNGAATRTLVAALRNTHPTDPWMVANQTRVEGLRRETEQHDRPPRLQVRDALGTLRGAPAAATRLAYLDLLVGLVAPGGGQNGDAEVAGPEHAEHEVRARAIAIACGDEAASVRARALSLAQPAPACAAEFWQTALADESPVVRCQACVRAADLLQAAAVPLLTAQLAAESDAMVLAAVDRELAALTGNAPVFAPGITPDPASRALLETTWRQRCSR
jgi:hypothetical protein